VPVEEQRVQPLFHLPAQDRVAAPGRQLGSADPPEFVARRDQEPPYPLAERPPFGVHGRRGQRALDRPELPVQDRSHQALLVGKVAVNRLLAHPQVTGEIVHTHPSGARREEQLDQPRRGSPRPAAYRKLGKLVRFLWFP